MAAWKACVSVNAPVSPKCSKIAIKFANLSRSTSGTTSTRLLYGELSVNLQDFGGCFHFFACSKISFHTMEFHSFVHTFLFWAPLLHGADLPNLANGGGARGYHRGAEKNRARTDRLVCAMRAYQHAYYAHITAHLSHFRISGHTGLSASTCLRIER